MERMCFPKLCDCPYKEIPLCPDEKRKENLCLAFKLLAAATLVAALFDSGILRHPIHTTRLTEALTDQIKGAFSKDEDEDDEDEEDKAEDLNQTQPKKRRELNPKWEYDMALKVHNMKNVWNAAVIGLMDMCIALANLPPYLVKKAKEKLGLEEEDQSGDIDNKKKGAKPKELKSDKKEGKK